MAVPMDGTFVPDSSQHFFLTARPFQAAAPMKPTSTHLRAPHVSLARSSQCDGASPRQIASNFGESHQCHQVLFHSPALYAPD